MTPRKTVCIAGAAIALYAAGAAFAQAPAPAFPAPRADQADRPDRFDRQMRFRRGGMQRRDPAEHLRAVLQLKPGQEPALKAFLAAMEPPAPQMTPAGTPAPRTTPERLALEEKRLAERTGQVRARLDATRRFYDQLDAGQKRAFDELAPMMGDRGRMGPPMPVMMRHTPMPPMAPTAAPPPKS